MALRVELNDPAGIRSGRWRRPVTSAVALLSAAAAVVWACAPQVTPAPQSVGVRPLLPRAEASTPQTVPAQVPAERTAAVTPPATVADLPSVPPRAEAAPARAALRVDTVMEMRSTAYCLRGSMRTGVRVRDGMAAADPRVLPLGSVIRVSHRDGREIGIFVIMDTGGAVRGDKLDIWLSSCAEARDWGIQRVVAEVISIGRR